MSGPEWTKAAQLIKESKFEDAHTVLGELLQREPQNPRILFALGQVSKALGQLDKAQDFMEQALQLAPNEADWYSQLGDLLSSQGKLEASIKFYQQAVDLKPDHIQALNNIAVAQSRLGQVEASIRSYRQVLQLDPDYLISLNNLASLLFSLERFYEAVKPLQRLVQLRPNDPSLKLKLGIALAKAGQGREAVSFLREIETSHPNDPAVVHALSFALKEDKKDKEALQYAVKAADLDPENAEAQRFAAYLLTTQGQFEEAEERLERSLVRNPNSGRAWYTRIHIKRCTEGDRPKIPQLEALVSNPNIRTDERASALYALGKLHNDLEEWDQAFARIKEANELLPSTWDKQNFEDLINALMTVFSDASIFEEKRKCANPSSRPIFVLGMARSGTSLVEQILCSHPAIGGAGELRQMDILAHELPRLIGTSTPYPQCIAELTPQVATPQSKRYVQELLSFGSSTDYTVDKMPANYRHLGLIAILFPNAHIIHCRRDPMAVCVSCYFQAFQRSGQHYAKHLDTLGHYYKHYTRMMNHWRKVLPIAMLEIDYESLVQNKEMESKRLIEFCGLDWDEQCLDFHKTDRTVRTASSWQVRQPIYTTAMAHWKHYESYLDPLKKAMEGYLKHPPY